MTSTTAPVAPASPKSTLIETGGIEAIPLNRRHGSPWQLFATWSAPNLEFATVFVGVIAVAFFGLGFWEALLAIVVGAAAGSLTQGLLTTWGPREGLAQMVLSRTAFGYRGNILPAALNTVLAGVGWFAVNSISGAFALATLTGMPKPLALVIIVAVILIVAFIGHDFVQIFERYATYILGAIFLVAIVFVFASSQVNAPVKGGGFSFAGFTLAAGAVFGYVAGWNPYSADYSRYLPASTPRRTVGLAAGLGMFISCTVLMTAGAAAATIAGFNPDNPTDSFTSTMPDFVRGLILIAIAVGAIAANTLNIYSGAMSFLAAGAKIPFALRRAIVAVSFGIIGFFIALSVLADAGHNYENFLLVIAYWVAPWLGVVLVDRFLRRGTDISRLVTEKANYRNASGVIAFLVGLVISVGLFANQQIFTGLVPKAIPAVGDLTAIVGLLVSGIVYFVAFRFIKPVLGSPLDEMAPVAIGIDAADDVA